MNLIISLLLSIMLNQNDVLVQQSGASVPLSDVDSYFNEIPPDVRSDLSFDNMQLESNIIGMLNMNIIYDYIHNQGLINQSPFSEVVDNVLKQPVIIDETVYKRLQVPEDQFKANYLKYLTKKALYSTLQDHLYQNIDEAKAVRLAQDRFLVFKNQYRIPEKRDIAMIKLSMADYNQSEVLSLVKQLMADDSQQHFRELANKVSTDQTVKYNDGQLGQFHQAGFRYPFAEEVFAADMGVVPAVYKKDQSWYIVRVNDIIPSQEAEFSAHKDELVAKIKTEMMERQFQSIINEYAQHEIKINKELVDDIFSRYEVFQ
ncbi:MAG: hypothetical protein DWP95_03775 [Proteobacteria bacterium]|nr:MAG: hypothetical protein DWP95_03775 [Pseudomonadota bacterium]